MGGPIFIIGAMGSGTTLLRLMLDSHPRIAVPQETGFMRAYNAHRFIPFKWSGRNWAKRLGWSHAELDEVMRELYDRLFMRYAERHGKVRWGEKTPLHTWHIDDMARVFPDARFVGIVRHPGGSVASNMTRWRHGLTKAAWHYNRYNKELARQAARYPDRFAVLRYEDLVLRPEPALRELLDWLGEPWSEQVLEHHEVQGSRGGKLSVEGRNRVDDPIDVSRIDKWTRTLDGRTRRRLGARLSRLGEFFGYAFHDVAVLEPLGAPGSLLATGADIEARIDAFPDLDIRTRMPVPLPDRLYHPREMRLVAIATDEEDAAAPAGADGPQRLPAAVREAAPRVLRRAAQPVARRLPPGLRRRLRAAARRPA